MMPILEVYSISVGLFGAAGIGLRFRPATQVLQMAMLGMAVRGRVAAAP